MLHTPPENMPSTTAPRRIEQILTHGDGDLRYRDLLVVVSFAFFFWQVAKALRSNLAASKSTTFPIVDQGRWWDVFNLKAKMNFYLDGRQALEQASRQAPGKPFRMLGPGMLVTILPPEYADEIRNDKRLSFSTVVAKVSSLICGVLTP